MGDTASDEFRDALLSETLRHVRRGRRRRRTFQSALALLGVVAVSVSVLMLREPAPVSPRTAALRPSLIIVHSVPLLPQQVVSSPAGNLAFVTSSKGSLVLVGTRAAERLYQEIDHEYLFALLAGRPAGLVRSGPNRVELIFLNPVDRDGFVIQ